MLSLYYYNQFLITFNSEYKIATVLLVKFAATEFILSFELKFGRVGLNIPLVSTFPIFSEAAFGAENLCILCRKLMQFVNFVPNFCCFAGISFKILFWLKKSFLRFIVIQREHRFEKIILLIFSLSSSLCLCQVRKWL